MFQVTQVDAFIENAPGYRFAFAIETTVTTEERDVIMANMEHIPKVHNFASKKPHQSMLDTELL